MAQVELSLNTFTTEVDPNGIILNTSILPIDKYGKQAVSLFIIEANSPEQVYTLSISDNASLASDTVISKPSSNKEFYDIDPEIGVLYAGKYIALFSVLDYSLYSVVDEGFTLDRNVTIVISGEENVDDQNRSYGITVRPFKTRELDYTKIVPLLKEYKPFNNFETTVPHFNDPSTLTSTLPAIDNTLVTDLFGYISEHVLTLDYSVYSKWEGSFYIKKVGSQNQYFIAPTAFLKDGMSPLTYTENNVFDDKITFELYIRYFDSATEVLVNTVDVYNPPSSITNLQLSSTLSEGIKLTWVNTVSYNVNYYIYRNGSLLHTELDTIMTSFIDPYIFQSIGENEYYIEIQNPKDLSYTLVASVPIVFEIPEVELVNRVSTVENYKLKLTWKVNSIYRVNFHFKIQLNRVDMNSSKTNYQYSTDYQNYLNNGVEIRKPFTKYEFYVYRSTVGEQTPYIFNSNLKSIGPCVHPLYIKPNSDLFTEWSLPILYNKLPDLVGPRGGQPEHHLFNEASYEDTIVYTFNKAAIVELGGPESYLYVNIGSLRLDSIVPEGTFSHLQDITTDYNYNHNGHEVSKAYKITARTSVGVNTVKGSVGYQMDKFPHCYISEVSTELYWHVFSANFIIPAQIPSVVAKNSVLTTVWTNKNILSCTPTLAIISASGNFTITKVLPVGTVTYSHPITSYPLGTYTSRVIYNSNGYTPAISNDFSIVLTDVSTVDVIIKWKSLAFNTILMEYDKPSLIATYTLKFILEAKINNVWTELQSYTEEHLGNETGITKVYTSWSLLGINGYSEYGVRTIATNVVGTIYSSTRKELTVGKSL